MTSRNYLKFTKFYWNSAIHAHSFTVYEHVYGCFHATAELSSCDRDHLAGKAEHICYLGLYRKSLQHSALEETKLRVEGPSPGEGCFQAHPVLDFLDHCLSSCKPRVEPVNLDYSVPIYEEEIGVKRESVRSTCIGHRLRNSVVAPDQEGLPLYHVP